MAKKNQNTKLSFSAEIFEWLEMIIISACVVLLAFNFVIRPAMVDGRSMDSTLHHGELLLVSDVLFEPKRGDIIVFQKIDCEPHSKPIVKRVIATEGETVDIDFETWEVKITDKNGNTQILDESKYRQIDCGDVNCSICAYNRIYPNNPNQSNQTYPYEVGEGELFVMGDNRNHSLDSRNTIIDTVKEEEIIGKVLCRAFPLNKFAFFN